MMSDLKKISVILFFGCATKAALIVFASADGLPVKPYTRLLIDLIFYGLVFGAILQIIKPDLGNVFLGTRRNRAGIGPFLFSILMGVVLYSFARGQNAVEVIIAAQFDRNFAYTFWNFYPSAQAPPRFFSLYNLAHLACFALIAPVIEEIVFRGVMLKSLLTSHSRLVSAILTSIIFTGFHLKNEFYLAFFIFSLLQSYLYFFTRSLLLNCVVHAVYNFIAYVITNYADSHLIRSIDEIDSPRFWLPELAMWFLSIAVLIYAASVYSGSSGENRDVNR